MLGKYAGKCLQIKPTKCCEEILGFLPKQQHQRESECTYFCKTLHIASVLPSVELDFCAIASYLLSVIEILHTGCSLDVYKTVHTLYYFHFKECTSLLL